MRQDANMRSEGLIPCDGLPHAFSILQQAALNWFGVGTQRHAMCTFDRQLCQDYLENVASKTAVVPKHACSLGKQPAALLW